MQKNKAIIVGLFIKNDDREVFQQEMDELYRLAETFDYEINSVITQNKSNIDPSTYLGIGKIKSIINVSNELKINTLIFNNELTPSHFKNINKICKSKIILIDRNKLILDIFMKHAKTNESKKQIKLATLEYMLPRLTGMWTHLERQMGGIGTRGGPGEKQIEIDRRLIRRDIDKLKKELKNISKQRKTQRKNRKNIFKICLVGYTNAGKSTLMKELSGYNSFIKDELFATLDTTTKITIINNKYKVLLSDTVGFLTNLPHNLIASFKSTLEEIIDADLIIKVIDANTKYIDNHIKTINDTLKMLESEKKDSFYVFFKIYLFDDKSQFTYINKKFKKPLLISSTKKLNLNHLNDNIIHFVEKNLITYTLKIRYEHYNILSDIYENVIVEKKEEKDDHVKLIIKSSKNQYNSIIKKIKKKNP